MFQFPCNKKHYLTHPWLWVGDLFRNIKWAWQRVYRGWDDRVPWSIDWHLCQFMPDWLRVLRDSKIGFPIEMYDDDFDWTGVWTDTPEEKHAHEKAVERWKDTLDEMITGFEAGYTILNGNFPENDKAFEISKHIDDSEESFRAYSDAIDRDKLKAEEDKAQKEYERGMELFVKYFFALWD